jgi:hypothetical protein
LARLYQSVPHADRVGATSRHVPVADVLHTVRSRCGRAIPVFGWLVCVAFSGPNPNHLEEWRGGVARV